MSSTSASAGRSSPPSLIEGMQASAPSPDAMAVLAALQQTMTAGTTDSIFRDAAHAAQIVTGASGIALALRANGVIICRARSGEMAPQIGSKLDADSGISGECFRTSKPLLCTDTHTDDRVDAEVCRILEIRSIAVVPVCSRGFTIGILEAFSNRRNAFSAEQTGLLANVAEVVQATYERDFGVRDSALLDALRTSIQGESSSKKALEKKTTSPQPHQTTLGDSAPQSKRHYWMAGAVAALLLLTSAAAWMSWRRSEPELASSRPQSIAAQVSGSARPINNENSDPATSLPAQKPEAGRASTQPAGTHTLRDLRNAAQVEPVDSPASGLLNSGSPAPVASEASPSPGNASATSPANNNNSNNDEESPPTVVTTANNNAVGNLASVPVRMPQIGAPLSQGVTGGSLTRQIQPVYPALALTQRIEGSVVLEATISEDGSPRELKVLSGPAQLAVAAVEAIRQWRYQPSLLNGTPVAVKKQITIVFKAP